MTRKSRLAMVFNNNNNNNNNNDNNKMKDPDLPI